MIFIDTSFWISLFNKSDSNHKLSLNKIQKIDLSEILLPDQIYSETLTVLRNKVSEEKCKTFMDFIKDFNAKILFPSKKTFADSESIFKKFKKLSFADSLIIALTISNESALITFDKRMEKAYKQLKS